MEILTDYTLVIPTFNRPLLLKRLLSFIASKQTTFKIVVVDSSENSIIKMNKKLCEVLDLSITYIQYPPETAPVPKVLDGLRRVTTKYASICADDDLLFIDTIPECLNFLEASTDYVACHGYYINFGNNENGEYDIGLEYSASSLDGETFEKRVFQLLNNYQAISYAIFKASVMVDYVEAALNIEPYAYIELFTGIAPLISGKVKRLPLCYHARARQTSVSSHDNPRWNSNLWFADDPDAFVQEFVKYRERLKIFIIERSGYKIEDLDKLLSLLHAIYFFKSFDLSYIQRIVQRYFKIDTLTSQKDKMAFMRSLQHCVYTLYRKIFLGKPFIRRKANPKGSITFTISKNIARSVVNQSVLIDLQNYLLGLDEV